MSELKSFRIIQGDTGGYGAPSYKCDADGNRIEEWGDACEVYDKYEVDRLVGDLEESHKKEVEQLLMEIVKLKDKARQYEVLYKEKCRDINTQERFFAEERAHNKYKRCLAMAEMCEARYDEEDAKVNGCGASWEYISKEMKYWERWRWRWLELAEKPTWAKFLQLIHKEAK